VLDQAVRRFLKNKKDLVGKNIVHSSIIKLPHWRSGHLLNFSKEESSPSVFSDLNLHTQLIQAAIAKLCLPSCLHLLWNSLHLLEEADKHRTNIISKILLVVKYY